MALYQGLNQAGRAVAAGEGRDRSKAPQHRPEEAASWRRLQHEVDAPKSGGHWLDSMLGQGSRKALSFEPKTRRAEKGPAPAWRPKRMQAVGAPEAIPQGRKGVIRGLLVGLGLCWAVFALKPWQVRGDLKADLWALFSQPTEAERAARLAEAKKKELAEALRLAALPVLPGGGKALALWQDSAGKWWGVQANGLLSPNAGPSAKESLGLPELRGARPLTEEHGRGKRLRLDLGALELDALLPLQPGLASEVRVIQLGDEGPVLLTHDGTRCVLGREDWEKRQQRLGLVLADLGARGRRASNIDLRFEDTAVVR